MCMFLEMRKVNLTQHSSLFKQKNVFIGKSEVCPVTEFSGAEDKIDFDGNTRLLKCESFEHVYSSGLEIFQFKADEKKDYTSVIVNNIIPYTFAGGQKYRYFLLSRYKFIQ